MAHQVKDAVVRLRTLAGQWEVAGTDRSRGIVVENLQLDWDGMGPQKATFDLKRLSRTPWPDIAAFTDVEIDVGGVRVWKGRVSETPARDADAKIIAVQCEGMQYHLDDDVLTPSYVKSNLADWKDVRSWPGVDLTNYKPRWTVQNDDGVIVLGFPIGSALTSSDFVGVGFDAGPDVLVTSIAIILDRPAIADGNTYIFARGGFTPSFSTGGFVDAISQQFGSGLGTYSLSGNFPSPIRYIQLFQYFAGTATASYDDWIRIRSITLTTKSAYLSSGASVLKASDVVTDAARFAPLLDSSLDRVATTSFNIPDMWSGEKRTPRETMLAANAYHNYMLKVDERAKLVFQPLPTAPLVEVGDFTAITLEDSANNSGADIYNRCVVDGTDSQGIKVQASRTAGQQTGVPFILTTSAPPLPAFQPVFTNPGFEVDASSWTASGPAGYTFARTTTAGEFLEGVGGGKWDLTGVAAGGQAITALLSGTFKGGVTYRVDIAMKASAAYGAVTITTSLSGGLSVSTPLTTSFQVFNIYITPDVDTSGVTFTINNGSKPAPIVYVDSGLVYRAVPTLADRRGFRRTKVLQPTFALDIQGTVAQQLADVYLAGHKNAQFKGTASVTGPVREILTGKSIPPEQLGLRTGELLRFNDRTDPDTGAVGRDGRLAAVKYVLDADTATVTIDNTSQNFEALLSRLAVVSGGT